MKNIIIADDHAVVRIGIKQLLKSIIPDSKIIEVADVDKILEEMDGGFYDLLILDINIAGGNSTKMVEAIKSKAPTTKILVFSSNDEQKYSLPYLQAGADGYLSKSASENAFTQAVESVLSNRKYMSEEMQQINISRLINPSEFVPDSVITLSSRETDVLNLLKEGLGTAKIAEELGLQLSTVSTYKARIFEKHGVKNIVALITKIR